jgi:hypothetical protein
MCTLQFAQTDSNPPVKKSPSADEPTAAANDESSLHFAGTIQIDYLGVPGPANLVSNDGLTSELSLKISADITRSTSANVKVCHGCHGFELGAAAIDIRYLEELNLRVGRFTPAFGEFPVRHDPANHRTSDKPLPYDMGRMLRSTEFGVAVIPSPHVDTGIELHGRHSFGPVVELDYATHLSAGFKGFTDGLDISFVESRTPLYIDNNTTPEVGGHLSLTVLLGKNSQLTFGGSSLFGAYDPENELSYWIAGANIWFRHRDITIRGEYLIRRTEMDVGDAPELRLKFGPGPNRLYDDFFLMSGFYAELELPTGSWINLPRGLELTLLGRFDGLRRTGNVGASSALSSDAQILRGTAALDFRFLDTLHLKLSIQRYYFSDFEDEWTGHLGLVAAFY